MREFGEERVVQFPAETPARLSLRVERGAGRLRYPARIELHPGVFTSSLTDAAWEPHRFGGEIYVLCEGPEVETGLYRFAESPEPVRWTIPGRETKLILEGACRIEFDGGPVLEFKAGDIFSLPTGDATWHFTAPYKEFYVLLL